MTPAALQSPSPQADLRTRAAKRVESLLTERLRRGRVSTSRSDWFLQVEAGEPQAYPGGWQVRVRTWRHWSDALVHFDADNGDVLYRCVDRLAYPPTDVELAEGEALRIAATLIEIPREAEFARFWNESFADGGYRLSRLEWEHVHNGLRVDGDYLWVMIHPETHRLVAFGRKWRTIR